MPDSDAALERRLAAVERTLDGEPDPEPSDEGSDERDDLESRVAALESRVDELDAAVQSVRGFLGGVSAVNESVEQRADAAVAAVERLERRLDDRDDTPTREGDEPAGVPPTTTDGDATQRDGAEAGEDQGDPGLRERLRGLR